MLQLHPCRCSRKLPVNRRPDCIASCLHRSQLAFKSGFGGNTLVQTPTCKAAEFDFGHIEPTAVLGRVMELQLQDAWGHRARHTNRGPPPWPRQTPRLPPANTTAGEATA